MEYITNLNGKRDVILIILPGLFINDKSINWEDISLL